METNNHIVHCQRNNFYVSGQCGHSSAVNANYSETIRMSELESGARFAIYYFECKYCWFDDSDWSPTESSHRWRSICGPTKCNLSDVYDAHVSRCDHRFGGDQYLFAHPLQGYQEEIDDKTRFRINDHIENVAKVCRSTRSRE